MSCTICTKTNTIPQCSGVLVIGTIAVEEAVVKITDPITTRSVWVDPEISEGSVVSIDLEPLSEFISPNLTYNLEVYEGMEETTPLEVSIGADEYTCFNINVQKIQNIDGTIEGPEEITLTVDA